MYVCVLTNLSDWELRLRQTSLLVQLIPKDSPINRDFKPRISACFFLLDRWNTSDPVYENFVLGQSYCLFWGRVKMCRVHSAIRSRNDDWQLRVQIKRRKKESFSKNIPNILRIEPNSSSPGFLWAPVRPSLALPMDVETGRTQKNPSYLHDLLISCVIFEYF